MKYKPGEEPIARTDTPEELETDRVNAEPDTPQPPSDPSDWSLSLSTMEAIVKALCRKHPGDEAKSEAAFSEELEKASAEANKLKNLPTKDEDEEC